MATWFELGLSSEFVPEHFPLVLDTHPPVVTWGTPSGDSIGETFSLPYTVNEPRIVSAFLVDAGGTEIPLVVTPTELTAVLPPVYGGAATVVASTKDAVWNEGVSTLTVLLEGPPLIVEDKPAAGGRPLTVGPAFTREEHLFAALSASVRVQAFDFAGSTDAVNRRQQNFAFDAVISARRTQQFLFSHQRSADLLLAQALREDEELLLLS